MAATPWQSETRYLEQCSTLDKPTLLHMNNDNGEEEEKEKDDEEEDEERRNTVDKPNIAPHAIWAQSFKTLSPEGMYTSGPESVHETALNISCTLYKVFKFAHSSNTWADGFVEPWQWKRSKVCKFHIRIAEVTIQGLADKGRQSHIELLRRVIQHICFFKGGVFFRNQKTVAQNRKVRKSLRRYVFFFKQTNFVPC